MKTKEKQPLSNSDFREILNFRKKYEKTLKCLSFLKKDLSRKYILTNRQINILNKKNLIDWNIYCISHSISEKFIEEHRQNIIWEIVLQKNKYSEEFLKKENVKFHLIVAYQKVSEEFLREEISKNSAFDVTTLCSRHKLSVKFIEDHFPLFENRLSMLIWHQELTEEFLEKHINSLDKTHFWNDILRYQKNISFDFIEKYVNNFSWDKSLTFYSKPYEFYKRFIHKFTIENLKEIRRWSCPINSKIGKLIDQTILIDNLDTSKKHK